MAKNLKQIFEGTGIGLLGGLLISITDSDWIRLIIALALIAITGNSLKDSILKADISPRQSYTGIAAFFAVLVGLYINGQRIFEQSPSDAVHKWEKAGYSPEESRALYLKQWEWENQKDSEPSPAVQSMIKSMLDRMGSESPASEPASESEQPNPIQDSGPIDVEEELPVVPAEG
jgi:hypothetical protein